MELTFLGTSSGVPTKLRNVSGLALRRQADKNWYLVDCGEGTQHQLLHTKLSLKYLRSILITHIHGDHCYGLPGLLATTAMSGRTESLTIIGPKGIEEMVASVAKVTDLHLSYEINFIAVEEMNSTVEFDEFSVSSIELSHRVPCFAYAFSEKSTSRKLDIEKLNALKIPRGPLWGKIQGGETVELDDGTVIQPGDCYLPETNPRKFIICGDNDTPDLLKQELNNANLVVHEATYTQDIAEKVGAGPQHSCARRVAEFAESCGVANLILTHFSARYQNDQAKSPSIFDIENEAIEQYSGNLFIANDLDIYQLDKEGNVSKIQESDTK